MTSNKVEDRSLENEANLLEGGETSKVSDRSEEPSGCFDIETFEFAEAEFSELTNTLPLGMFVDGEHLRSIQLVDRLTTKIELEVETIMKRHKRNLLEAAPYFLGKFIKSIGNYSLSAIQEKMGEASIDRVFSGMYFCDVLHLILAVRTTTSGSEIFLQSKCPNCGGDNSDDSSTGGHQLNTINVKYLDEELTSPLGFLVRLKDGLRDADIENEDGKYAPKYSKQFVMQPYKWWQAKKVLGGKKTDKSTAHLPEDIVMLCQMVKNIPDSILYGRGGNTRREVFNVNLYTEITLKDAAILKKAIQKLQPGPEILVDIECIHCSHEYQESLPWANIRAFLFDVDSAA
jgi:hypothetical protein